MSSGRENRSAQRFKINNKALGSIRLEGIGEFPLWDLSYGGFSVQGGEGMDALQNLPIGERVKFSLRLLGDLEAKGEVLPIFWTSSKSGFAFCHESPNLLIYLNPHLEKMRIGSTLSLLPTHMLQDKYKEAGWKCMHGDGPTDFRYFTPEGATEPTVAMLSFRIGEDYHDVFLKNGRLTSRTSIDKEGVAARMGQDVKADPKVLRQALSILIGQCGGNFESDVGLVAMQIYREIVARL